MGRNRDVSNTEDILDSRDVLARRDELKDEREGLAESLADADEAADNTRVHLADAPYGTPGEIAQAEENQEAAQTAREALAEWDEENAEELAALEAFIAEGSSSWEDGETLVRESHFEDYARDLVEELDLIKSNAQWPYTCIDWEHAARELMHDYTGADLDGVTYLYRA